ncbi:hypothetical protein KPL70_001186 [Citrus sinensis]|nr:hypothetical protein KPL70_001186 [Citrus sinensis]
MNSSELTTCFDSPVFPEEELEKDDVLQIGGSMVKTLWSIFGLVNMAIESNPITIRKKVPERKLLDSDRTIESEHPPLRSVTVDHGELPVQIRASPYKISKPNDSEANLSSIIQQNNFCNTNLNTIGKQLNRIENQIQKSTITVLSISPIPTKSDSDKKLKEPIFKPFQVSKTSQKLVQESKSDFAKAIREQLDRIEAASSSSSKVQIAPNTPQSSKIGVLEQDQMSIASSNIEGFKEETLSPKANKIHWELALPTVKTPLDLAIDNRPSALNQSRYNASSVYEWNIDGMSEYNILGLLQQMTMAANAYKTQAGTSDRAISEILIAGFTGQLKGWWDHLLTNQQQLDILNSIQVDENGVPIFDEFNNPIQDAVATLILIISLHFIGDPSHLRDKNAELLHNLRCRKLSEFQSYKTSFFTRLFLRDDANHITWKEKFLAGLPTLLGEKVRNSIKALYDNRIPYDELTYGELVSFVNKEGLKICQDLKLQKRLKWELKKSKQELSSFCKQFNYDPFKTSISKDCNGECSTKPRRKHYKSKNFRKPFRNFRELPYKKPSRPYKKPKFSKRKEFRAKPKTPFNYKEAICHKCGMKGHTANYCRMNKKLHELDLDEEILSKLAPLLVESSDSESSMSGDSDPYQVDELFDSDDSVSSSSESESDSYLKKINVLTKDQETFLELVKHISDPNLQKEYLDKLLKTLDFNKAETSKVPIVKKNSYDLTQILDKKKTKKTDNSDNESNPDDGDDIKVENIESVPNDFLFVLKQITTRKYLIKVTLIFSDDFAMDAIALFDTSTDLNCIREDIVPKRFHEKTKERLYAANNSKLNVSSKIMPPKKKDKGKAVLKDSESRATSKEPQATPSKDKLLSSAMPIKSWIEMVEEHGAHYKTTSSDDQVKQWMSSITKSPELMLALQNLSQSQIFSKEEKENPISKEISKPSSQNVIVSGAKTEEEYFKAMEQLLASRSKSSVADTSEDEDEDEDEEPFISLGDENEDDCFGIFSPLKHYLPYKLYVPLRQRDQISILSCKIFSSPSIPSEHHFREPNLDKDSAEGCKSIPIAILTKPKIDHKVLTMDPPICRTSSFSSSSSGKTSESKHVTDLSKANTVIPKPIQWKDVNLPEEWILEGAAPPAIPKQLEPNTELQNVTQYSDGKVKLSFRRSTSSRFSDKASCSSIPSLERKFTKIPSVINLPFQSIKSQPRFSTSDIPSTSIRLVDYTTSVPHPIYTSNQHVQSQEEKEPSPPTSPTFSAVTENVINVIEKEFELDKTFLHNDFYSDLNKEKRLWFFKHFLNQRKEIQQTYYEFVNFHKIRILFFDWFEIYSSDNNISYPFKESNPITIRKKVPEWKLLDSDRTIESEHPPLRSVTVDHGEPPVQIRASPYKIPKPNDSEANLSSIIQQNNFCNTNLNTIGKQLNRIENQIQKSTITVPSISPIPTKSDSDKKLKEPIYSFNRYY